MKTNQAFFILSNKPVQALQPFYEELELATRGMGVCQILHHRNNLSNEEGREAVKQYPFTNEILTELNYCPIGFSLLPGNNHFPLLKFFTENPGYDFYWIIEDDVRYNGNWQDFFEAFSSCEADFVATHIRTSQEVPFWYWWSTLANPYVTITFNKRIRSFNPIYRISKAALAFLHKSLIQFWCGHHEVLIPTLLHNGGFTLVDMGGTGSFAPDTFKNRFYEAGKPDIKGELTTGTMRYRPAFDRVGEEKNKLYHPVKVTPPATP